MAVLGMKPFPLLLVVVVYFCVVATLAEGSAEAHVRHSNQHPTTSSKDAESRRTSLRRASLLKMRQAKEEEEEEEEKAAATADTTIDNAPNPNKVEKAGEDNDDKAATNDKDGREDKEEPEPNNNKTPPLLPPPKAVETKEEEKVKVVKVDEAIEEDAESSKTIKKVEWNNRNVTAATAAVANLNVTAISLTACEQIEMAVAFLTSLDLDKAFLFNFTSLGLDPRTTESTTSKSKNKSKTSKRMKRRAYMDLYLLQLIITPLSLAMVFFGSNLLLPTCCMAAACLGVFLVFHLVDYLSKSSSRFFQSIDIDCQMKLALSVVSASISAMAASTFVRFGLFSVGALAAGGGSYLIFDAFPFLDPTREDGDVGMMHHDGSGETSIMDGQYSELSPFGWAITILAGVGGGIILRWYEQASLEAVTAMVGGVGCAYSLHSFIIIHGGQLNRSLVFLIANFIGIFGWRFQRGRRLRRDQYYHKKSYSEEPLEPRHITYAALPNQAPMQVLAPPPPQQQQQQQQPPPIDQLHHSLGALQGLLQGSQAGGQQQQAPSSEEIVELTQSLNTLLKRIGTGSGANDSSEKKN